MPSRLDGILGMPPMEPQIVSKEHAEVQAYHQGALMPLACILREIVQQSDRIYNQRQVPRAVQNHENNYKYNTIPNRNNLISIE